VCNSKFNCENCDRKCWLGNPRKFGATGSFNLRLTIIVYILALNLSDARSAT